MSQLKTTLFIAEEVISRVRNAAYWRKEPLAHIINRALEKEAKAMEHSNGGKYKPRARALKAGRPKTTAAVLLCLLSFVFAACSGTNQVVQQIPGDGGKAVFEKDKEGRIVKAVMPDPHYKVLTRQSVESWTVSQISYQTVEHCSDMYTSEEMAMLKQQSKGTFISQYTKCRNVEKPTLTTEPGKFSYFKEVVAAGLIAGGLAYGLSSMDFGGDTTNAYANGGAGGAGGAGGMGGRGYGYGGTAKAYGGNSNLSVRGRYW